MRNKLIGLLGAALLGAPAVANASAANCGATDIPLSVPSGSISVDTTWSGTVVLQGPVFVDGDATLTIVAGTIVRGQPRQDPSAAGVTLGTPGTLIATRKGRIVAEGTAANSIIMTTAATDNDADGVADDVVTFDASIPGFIPGPDGFADPWEPGDVFLDDTCGSAPLPPLNAVGLANVSLWGGVVILGNAPVNLADGVGLVEGFQVPSFTQDTSCGGNEPHDNSGILRYVSVRHAGDEIGNSNELNGVTMCGVGDCTVVDHVEVYANFDDGFEWFGGTVNGTFLNVSFVGDDSFDGDQGYTGVNQFLFTQSSFMTEDDTTPYGSASGDSMFEIDGVDLADLCLRPADGTPCPHAGYDFWNFTGLGNEPLAEEGAGSFVEAADNGGAVMTAGYAGHIYNSVFLNTGAAAALTVSGAGAPAGHSAVDHVVSGEPAVTERLDATASVVCTTFDNVPALAGDALTALSKGDARSDMLIGVTPAPAARLNSVNPATFGVVKDDTTFEPSSTALLDYKLDASLKSSPINPRLVTGGLGRPNAGCPQPCPSCFDRTAVYRGAFPISSADLWTTGWTALNQGGLLVD